MQSKTDIPKLDVVGSLRIMADYLVVSRHLA